MDRLTTPLLLCSLTLTMLTATAGTPGFLGAPRTDSVRNGAPTDLLTGDLNNDGNEDLVIIQNETGGYSIHLGDGSGNFALGEARSVFPRSQSGQLADINADGELDIVVQEGPDDRFTVFLGNGDGTFEFDGDTALELNRIRDFRLTDLTGDGNPELVAVFDLTALAVLESMPEGAAAVYWGAPELIALGDQADSVSVADIDDDGDDDVVVAFASPANRYSLFMNDGTGTLTETQSIAAGGGQPTTVAPGDFNNDGITDLVYGIDGGEFEFLSVLAGLGEGLFATPVMTQISRFGLLEVIVGDYNNDGLDDIAGPAFIDDSLLWAPGNGDLTFGPFVLGGSGGNTFSVAQFDANQDGIEDVVSINIGSDDFTVHSGTGNDTFFNTPRVTVIGAGVSQIAAGDVTGDDLVDVLTADAGSGVISILSDLSDGVYQRRDFLFLGLANPTSVQLGDLNGDAALDVVVGDSALDTVSVFLADGAGGFAPPVATGVCGELFRVALGDVDGDDRLDAVAACFDNGEVSVLRGDGNGGLILDSTLAAAGKPQELRLADLNSDGALDIVLADSTNNDSAVRALFGNGDGTFGAVTVLAPGEVVASVAIGDVNNDGTLDLAIGDIGDGLMVAIGTGDGTFSAPIAVDGPLVPLAVALFDTNGDGFDDVLAIEASGGNNDKGLTVTVSNGDGSFEPLDRFAVATGVDAIDAQPSALRTLTLADVNGDGLADVLAGSAAGGDAGVLSVDLNRSDVQAPVDTDGDGVPDAADNCSLLANPSQRDTNGDGFGNRCDPDLNDDGIVNFIDIGLFRDVFGTTDADADFNGNGVVDVIDFRILRSFLFSPPGPGAM